MHKTRIKHSPWGLEGLINEVFHSNINDLVGVNADLIQSAPVVNVYESPEYFRLEFAIPGMKREDISLHIEDGILTVSSDIEVPKAEDESTKSKQFSFHKFKKTYRIPRSVDHGKVSAKLDAGVLTVHLYKADGTKPRNIDIV